MHFSFVHVLHFTHGKKCPNSELFCSAFSRIHSDWIRWDTVYLRIQSKCGKMRTRVTPNTDTYYAVTTIALGLIHLHCPRHSLMCSVALDDSYLLLFYAALLMFNSTYQYFFLWFTNISTVAGTIQLVLSRLAISSFGLT